jgi:hypothetical protein
VLNELDKVLIDYQGQLVEIQRAQEAHRKPSATNTERSDLIAWLEQWRSERYPADEPQRAQYSPTSEDAL